MNKIMDAKGSLLSSAIALQKEAGARSAMKAIAAGKGAEWLAEAGSWDAISTAVEDLRLEIRKLALDADSNRLMEALSGADDGLARTEIEWAHRARP